MEWVWRDDEAGAFRVGLGVLELDCGDCRRRAGGLLGVFVRVLDESDDEEGSMRGVEGGKERNGKWDRNAPGPLYPRYVTQRLKYDVPKRVRINAGAGSQSGTLNDTRIYAHVDSKTNNNIQHYKAETKNTRIKRSPTCRQCRPTR